MTRAVTMRRHPGLNLGARHRSADAQAEVQVFGFWVFMMSDAILFGLLLATYVVMRGNLADGPGPGQLFEIRSVFIETLLLLCSSFAFGIAQWTMKHGESVRALVAALLLALLLACGFLALELHDFSSMAGKGGTPQVSGFLSAFFALVPLHGLHVTAACVWLLAILGQMARYGVDDEVKIGILRLGILWHFLDVVWIAIFSIVYIGGLA